MSQTGRCRALAIAGATVTIALGWAGPALAAGDADRGEKFYSSNCVACHSLDANRVGPMHRGVYGRKAGSVPGFAYSNAVKSSTVVWNEETLDKWLAGPLSFIPGNKMVVSFSNPQDRADVIAYLKRESGK